MGALIRPTRENIDKLLMDSVSERKFDVVGNIEIWKEKFEFADKMEDDLQKIDDKIFRMKAEIDEILRME